MQWPATEQGQAQPILPRVAAITSQAQAATAFRQVQEMQRRGVQIKSRWDDLRESVALLVELAAIFDASGIGIFFLNRPDLCQVTSSSSSQFLRAFQKPPQGSTPLVP